jgi:hypothetical protein
VLGIPVAMNVLSRLAGLQTGELDLAYGMTGKLLARVMADENLRWDPNFTSPWWLMFPGYAEADSPFHDKGVRQAVSLALNRTFLAKQETQGIGPPWGNGLSAEEGDALRGDGKDLPGSEYNPQKAKQLLAEAGFPNGFDYEWYVPFPPYLDMAERIITDLRAVGISRQARSAGRPPPSVPRSAKAARAIPATRRLSRTSIRAREVLRPTSASTPAPVRTSSPIRRRAPRWSSRRGTSIGAARPRHQDDPRQGRQGCRQPLTTPL